MSQGAQTNESETDDLDLGGMWRAMARRKSWIVGVTTAALAAALVFDFAVAPRFTADSQVLIENPENFYTGTNAANPETPPDDAAVASQIQLLTSRDLARQAIAKLDLDHDSEFNPRLRPGLASRLLAPLQLARSPNALSVEDTVLQNYYDRLNVYQVAKSRVLSVEFTSSDPELAARASNLVSELYIDVQRSAKRQEAKEAGASLGQQIVLLQKQLASAEDQAESFRASNGLLVGANNTTLSAQQLADLNSQLAAAQVAQANSSAKAKLIRDAVTQGRLDEISDIASNDLVRQIGIQRVGIRAQLALLSRTLLPRHPQILELRAQLADVDNQLRNAATMAARGLENDARVAAARYDNLRATLDEQKQTVGDMGADEVRMRGLDRTAKALSDQLDASTANYQAALARETATSMPGDARVISRAIAPELPSFPRKLPTVIFALAAGFILSASAAIAAEMLSQGGVGRAVAPGRDEPAEDLHGGIDMFQGDSQRRRGVDAEATSSARPMSRPGFAEIRTDRWELTYFVERAREIARDSKHAACVLVVGAVEGAPAGAAAVELGRRLASEGRSILVELSAGLLSGAGMMSSEQRSAGLGELVEGERSFAEVIDRDDESRLHFVVAGAVAAGVGESLDIAIEALGETYDYVVLLGSPIDVGALTRELAGAADLVALVGAESKERIEELRLQFLRVGAGEASAIEQAHGDDDMRRVDAA